MSKLRGYVAEFNDPGDLLHAAEKMRDAGYRKFDSHSPFPIHGMDQAMGLGRSKLGIFVSIAAIIGGLGAILMQWWMSAVDYKLVIAGKPFFSYQAFFPVLFSLTVLAAAVMSLFGMLSMIKLRFHHPVFYSENFSSKGTDDGFFLSVLSEDPQFNETATSDFLTSIGGSNVEVLEETS